MKKFLAILFLIFTVVSVKAQKKKPKKNVKDSVKTEVVHVVTSYIPKVSDATKLRKKPKIIFGKQSKKKPLQYTIFSAPVASTFIPKSGTVKGVDLGVKEQLYNNYIAGGFGNNNTPFFEMYLSHMSKFENEFGLYTQYISSDNTIETTPLNSEFSNFSTELFFKQKAHYFDWKINLKSERNNYNWYGIPNLPFTTNTINAIGEKQVFALFQLNGELLFDDSLINTISSSFSSFTDFFKSKETKFVLSPSFQFPLYKLGKNFNDLEVDTKIEFLSGNFVKDYTNTATINYAFINVSAHPMYRFKWNDFSFKLGTKLYFSADTENKLNDFFIYPDIRISYPVLKDQLFVYAGTSGDLYTNSYEQFVDENPFVSPTMFITTTNESYSFFGGFSGKFSNNVAFNIKGSYSNIEDKPLFIRNNSKSDGTFSSVAGVDLKGYEYGNSFAVFYDDIQTLSLLTEFTIDASKNISTGLNFRYNNYITTKQLFAYNLPNLEGNLFAFYKKDKVYAKANLFYVGKRKDLLYTGIYPSAISAVQTLKAYIDLNINGGYHFNDKFSAFLRMNNVFNTKYQRFSNFNVQGFQILAGATWKFDF